MKAPELWTKQCARYGDRVLVADAIERSLCGRLWLTGVFLASDALAPGLYGVVKRLGLRIPSDL